MNSCRLVYTAVKIKEVPMSHIPQPIQIRACAETDATAFRELRLEALRSHPEVFSADYASNEQAPPSFWSERLSQNVGSDGQCIFFAAAGGELFGIAGIRRGDSPKTRHDASIWGVYVRPTARGQQLAGRLIGACVAWAEQQQVRLIKLAVVTSNIAAIRCYVRSGFSVYGVDPQAIRWEGRFYDELLMVKQLRSDA
jgi:RimJ/RimL family protein N-acetyltransferase